MIYSKRRLRLEYFEGARIPRDRLRELWQLRVDMLELHKTPEEDWAYFRSFVTRPDSAILVFSSPDGRAQGFFTIAFMPVEHLGKNGLLLYSKYFYFREAYRGHYMTILAPWVLLPIGFRNFGLRPVHFVSTTFPQSFVSLSRSAGNVRALASPDITPWQRAALQGFVTELYPDDFDRARGIIRNQNVVDAGSMPRSKEAIALHAEYERLNPTWREGHTLPIIFSVNTTLVRTVARRTLRRLRPR